MQLGFEVEAAKPKGQRASIDDQPATEPMRPSSRPAAQRRNLTNDERSEKRKIRRSASQDDLQQCVHCGHPVEARSSSGGPIWVHNPNSSGVMNTIGQESDLNDPISDRHFAEPASDAYQNHALSSRRFAAFSGPGYYLVNADGSPASSSYPSMSQAEADIKPDSGHLVQYLDHAPNASHVAEPFPDQLNQVNGSRNVYDQDDEFLFIAASNDEEGFGSQWNPHNMAAELSDENADHEDDRKEHKESVLLEAMTKATGPEQQRLMGELEGLRRSASLQVEADREVDLSDAYIRDVMTPVAVHEHHTAATDWISEVAEVNNDPRLVQNAMVGEAAVWASRVSAAVKADPEEYVEQARGVARLAASTQGVHRELAFETFMRTAVAQAAATWDGADGQAAAGSVLPWSAGPQVLPPTGGGHAPFGVPQGAAPLNGQNFNPMATEIPNPGQAMPLDNGNSAWPPAQNLDGEESLPPVAAPDGFNPVGEDTHTPNDEERTASRRTAASNLPVPHVRVVQKSGGKFDVWHVSSPSHVETLSRHYDSDAAEKAAQSHAQELGAHYIPNGGLPTQASRTASEAFNGPKQTYQDYKSRLDPGAYPMSEDSFAGSLAGISPAPGNTTTPVTSMLRWAERGVDADPTGQGIAGNPMSGYDKGDNYDRDEARAQSGEAQTSLPLAPEGPQVAQTMFPPTFDQTGPGEVPSDRAPNIELNEGHQAARYADKRWDGDEDERNDHYFKRNSTEPNQCIECRESREGGNHFDQVPGFESVSYVHNADRIPGRGVDQKGPDFEPDRSNYVRTPQGQAESTEAYEEAYSSDRHIDYSETGIGQLGTVPVQGYGTNPQGEMFNWNLQPPGSGAANVAGVPAPGLENGAPGAPQPTDVNGPEEPEGKEARLRAARARVRNNIGGRS